MRALAVGLLALTCGLGCGPSTEAKWAGDPGSLVPELCGNPPKPAKIDDKAAEKRMRGIEALRRGDFINAKQRFEDALDLEPSNVALVALHAVAEDGVAVSVTDSVELFDKQRPIKIEREDGPPAGRKVRTIPFYRVGEVSVETNEDHRLLNAASTDLVPRTLRRVNNLKQVIGHAQGGVIVYQRNQRHYVVQLMQTAPRVRVADYSAFVDKDNKNQTQVVSAAFDGDVLYSAIVFDGEPVLMAHNRHTGKSIWQRGGSHYGNLRVVGDHLVVTAGKMGQRATDVVVLDRDNGIQVARQPLNQWNPYLAVRDGLVFSLSGSQAFVYELGPRKVTVSNGASVSSLLKKDEDEDEPNVFAFPPDKAVSIAEEHRCGVELAMAELDGGDFGAAAARMTSMERIYPNHPVVVALAATSRYMRRQGESSIDYSGIVARAVSPLPAPRTKSNDNYTSSLTSVGPVEAFEPLPRWAERHRVKRYSVLPDELPESIPRHYGRHALTEWVQDRAGGHTVIYGGRYVMLLRGDKVEAAFDGHTLFDDRANRSRTRGYVHLAERVGNKLLISFTDLMGRSGVASIDMARASVDWRTASDVYANNFVVARDHIIATMGGELLVIRPRDGELVGRMSPGGRLGIGSIRAIAPARERVLVHGTSGSVEFAITQGGGSGG